jgi:hypothetical protein
VPIAHRGKRGIPTALEIRGDVGGRDGHSARTLPRRIEYRLDAPV